MIVVPDSDIILIKSPLKLDNYNQITFGNATAQYNYFNSLRKKKNFILYLSSEARGRTYCLTFARMNKNKKRQKNKRFFQPLIGGQGWIRTIVRSRGQIYSLVPLTTRPPTHVFGMFSQARILL